MAGIRDIARISGTSIATVSRVLNNSGYVSAELRAKVEQTVRDTGFRPNAGARQMRTQESRMVALILPALDLHFFGILAHEVEQALSACGYTAMICSTAEDPVREDHYVSALLAQRVDGVLVVSVTQKIPRLRSHPRGRHSHRRGGPPPARCNASCRHGRSPAGAAHGRDPSAGAGSPGFCHPGRPRTQLAHSRTSGRCT